MAVDHVIVNVLLRPLLLVVVWGIAGALAFAPTNLLRRWLERQGPGPHSAYRNAAIRLVSALTRSRW